MLCIHFFLDIFLVIWMDEIFLIGLHLVLDKTVHPFVVRVPRSFASGESLVVEEAFTFVWDDSVFHHALARILCIYFFQTYSFLLQRTVALYKGDFGLLLYLIFSPLSHID